FLYFKEHDEGCDSPLFEDSSKSIADEPWKIVTIDANEVKMRFREYVSKGPSWVKDLWGESGFNMSDAALTQVCRSFACVSLKDIPFDLRSAALREFLTADLRRGLGIYLTPDDV